jgi:hypothetical protein
MSVFAFWQPIKIAIFEPRKRTDKTKEKRAQKTPKSRKAQQKARKQHLITI